MSPLLNLLTLPPFTNHAHPSVRGPMRRRIGLALLIAHCAVSVAVASDRFRATVEYVADGDSMTVRAEDGRRSKIRIAAIDAPEKGQPHADQAREALRRLVNEQTLEIEAIKTDPYGRQVARIWLDGTDLGLLMVSRGQAWHFTRYESDQTPRERHAYRAAQSQARQRRLGLWQFNDPVAPWDYRAAERRR